MRATPYLWWCHKGHKNEGRSRECVACGVAKYERHAQVHVHDRSVVYRHPLTGEYKTPPRTDMPMPERYALDGFERHEIMSMVEWEKTTGAVHEATNFNSGNEDRDCNEPEFKAPKELIDALARDVADAVATDPVWR